MARPGSNDPPPRAPSAAARLHARLLEAWRRPVHRGIASAAAVVAAFTFLSNVGSAAKDVVVAHRFGTADDLDAFLLALLVPSFAIGVVGGSLNSALMPAYVKEQRRGGQAAAQRLLSSSLAVSLLVLVGVAAVLAVIVPLALPVLASGFSEEKLRITRHLSLVLLPSLILAGTATTWTAVLNAHGRFAVPAASPLAVPVVAVAFLIAFGKAWGIYALAIGTVVGYAATATIVGLAVRRAGISIRPRWEGFTPEVRQVVTQYLPMAAGMLVLGANPMIDQLMAANLASGSVASLGYGGKLLSLAMGVGATSLGAAILPQFSRLAADKQWARLRSMMQGYALVVIVLAIPITLVGIGLSAPIVQLLFERGAFSHDDTLRVARIQTFYLAAVPIRLAGVFFVRCMIASRGNHILMWISVLNAILNVTANYVFSLYLGVAGIALSTSAVFALTNVLTFVVVRRRLRALERGERTPAVGVAGAPAGRAEPQGAGTSEMV